jgi:HD-GYP domain-containing protein (c-di-GMP phosphodiesterase class II)
MVDAESTHTDEVRTAEIIAALSLATDLAIGVNLEHGLQSTLIAMRLCDRLDVDDETRFQSYYLCLLFYVGCMVSEDIDSGAFGEDHALTTYAIPHRFGARAEMMTGMLRAVAPPTGSPVRRARQLARGVPRLVRGMGGQVAAICEVAQMLTDRLGLPGEVSSLFAYEGTRWDGKNWPESVAGEEIPLAARIVNVARDAAFLLLTSGIDVVADLMRQRAGRGLDPKVARTLAEGADEILDFDPDVPMWDLTLSLEPDPWLTLEGGDIDRALGAMGAFSDMASPYLVGHSAGVASLAGSAARCAGINEPDAIRLHRAGLIHDLGRVAVPVRIWQSASPMTQDDRERVRLHAYHTERILSRSEFLSDLGSIAGLHHERLDGSGYHRAVPAAALDDPARLMAAVDVYHAMTEDRAHRAGRPREDAAAALLEEARQGHLDTEAVTAVLEAAGHAVPSLDRPAGLTEREMQVIRLLARGRQTKQIARTLGISAKTADRHIQNAYRKMEVSTRAGATLFAVDAGLLIWGEFPMGRTRSDS